MKDMDLRQEGVMLMQNGLKAYSMAEQLFDEYNESESENSSKNWCCYMLQQSLELMLKGIIKYFYGSFNQSHSLAKNKDIVMELAEKHVELLPTASVLEDLDKPTIVATYKWSNLARYKDLWVKKEDVKKVEDLTYRLSVTIRQFCQG